MWMVEIWHGKRRDFMFMKKKYNVCMWKKRAAVKIIFNSFHKNQENSWNYVRPLIIQCCYCGIQQIPNRYTVILSYNYHIVIVETSRFLFNFNTITVKIRRIWEMLINKMSMNGSFYNYNVMLERLCIIYAVWTRTCIFSYGAKHKQK